MLNSFISASCFESSGKRGKIVGEGGESPFVPYDCFSSIITGAGSLSSQRAFTITLFFSSKGETYGVVHLHRWFGAFRILVCFLMNLIVPGWQSLRHNTERSPEKSSFCGYAVPGSFKVSDVLVKQHFVRGNTWRVVSCMLCPAEALCGLV